MFHFVLEGEGARGATLIAHSDAQLHFRFAVPPDDALASVAHPALDRARQDDLDIALQLTPRGAVSIVGERRKVAKLRGGQLRDVVEFALRAGDAPDVGDQPDAAVSGVFVEFSVQGETVHQMLLVVQVVPAPRRTRGAAPGLTRSAMDSPGALGTAPPLAALPLMALDNALPTTPPPAHRVKLTVSVDGSGLRMDLLHLLNGQDEWSGRAFAPKLDLAALDVLAGLVRSQLESSYDGAVWKSFDGSLPDGDAGRATRAALGRAMQCAAAAGARLNQGLREQGDLAHLLDYIEDNVPQAAVLTVSTNEAFLPWELLTPQHWSLDMTPKQLKKTPAPDPALFWGARYAIETVLATDMAIGMRKRKHKGFSPSRVSVNLNPHIDMVGLAPTAQPLQVHRDWAARLDAQGLLDGVVNEQCLPMRGVLQDADNQASLIYLYCHGSSAKAFGGSDELLQLDDGCKLSPDGLLVADAHADGAQSQDAYTTIAPLVFLNACQSGAHSPLVFSSFLNRFCGRGALGLIATSHSVPITFGAHFGPQVVDRYLQRRGSLAGMLLALRREHLLERGNPVPLFYTLQCQLNF